MILGEIWVEIPKHFSWNLKVSIWGQAIRLSQAPLHFWLPWTVGQSFFWRNSCGKQFCKARKVIPVSKPLPRFGLVLVSTSIILSLGYFFGIPTLRRLWSGWSLQVPRVEVFISLIWEPPLDSAVPRRGRLFTVGGFDVAERRFRKRLTNGSLKKNGCFFHFRNINVKSIRIFRKMRINWSMAHFPWQCYFTQGCKIQWRWFANIPPSSALRRNSRVFGRSTSSKCWLGRSFVRMKQVIHSSWGWWRIPMFKSGQLLRLGND